tara:strand:+ start:181 stop:975 length:795 start_codon:yes stop_codon:yes gene_type:complete
MTIRSKNPTHTQTVSRADPASQSAPTRPSGQLKATKKIKVLDVNAIHQQESSAMEGLKSEMSVTRPGQKFISQSLESLQNGLEVQKKDVRSLVEKLQSDELSTEDRQQLNQLQSEITTNQKKVQQLKRTLTWMRAGILEVDSSRVPQKFADAATQIDQMPNGPQRQEAQLTNLTSTYQQLRGPQNGIRLSVAEAGAMSRHQLGHWAPDLLPGTLLSEAVVSIFTQTPSNSETPEPVDQWLNQGFGGTNLKRLNVLAKVKALLTK